jgi:hypothetical protein
LAGGIIKDMLAFGAREQPLDPDKFAVLKQTITDNSKDMKTLRINCIDFESTDVTVTDITAQGQTGTCPRVSP